MQEWKPLEWQGEHPVILPEGTPVERLSKNGFQVIVKNQNLERGDTLQISINLPSDVWGKIESIWKKRDVILIVKDSSGNEIKNLNYGRATGFFQKVSFEEYAKIPDSVASGYASIELHYGDELKAADWFMIGESPVKDITADSFNRLLSANYQSNSHTFMQYAVNVEPDIKPEQIRIRKVRGTLQREISPPTKNYTIYYVFEIPVLNYTFVNLQSGETFNGSTTLSTLVTSREPLLEELVREYEIDLANSSEPDSTSNIVLGATNLRTFVYGPWQHYANGPLNILQILPFQVLLTGLRFMPRKEFLIRSTPWLLLTPPTITERSFMKMFPPPAVRKQFQERTLPPQHFRIFL